MSVLVGGPTGSLISGAGPLGTSCLISAFEAARVAPAAPISEIVPDPGAGLPETHDLVGRADGVASCAPPRQMGPRSYWKMDAASGNVVDELAVSGATLVPTTGLAYHAAPSPRGSSFSIGTSVSGGLQTLASNNIQVGRGTPGTFAMWVYFNGTTDPNGTYVWLASSFDGTRGFSFGLESSTWFSISVNSGTGQDVAYFALDITTDVWSHIVAVYYGDGRMELYQNGALGYSIGSPQWFYGATDTPVGAVTQFSDLPLGANQGLDGQLDEILFFQRALSQVEIKQAYLSGTDAGLTSIYSLTGTANGTATAVGVLTTLVSLTGTAAGTATAVGTLTSLIVLSGTAAGVATAMGVLTGTYLLTGTANGTATATGTAVLTHFIVGSVSGAATVNGTLDKMVFLSGTAAGVATVMGSLVRTAVLVGTANGVATATGTLLQILGLLGNVVGTATVNGILSLFTAGAVYNPAPERPTGDAFPMNLVPIGGASALTPGAVQGDSTRPGGVAGSASTTAPSISAAKAARVS